jgi:predicted RNase H-like nuclease (RuvC/YqgF family)
MSLFDSSCPNTGQQNPTTTGPLQRGHLTTITALQAQNRTFALEIADQKTVIAELHTTIEELRRQRRLRLRAPLVAAVVDPDTHARLQRNHNNLAAENTKLRRQLYEKRSELAVLGEDLAASRRAHADDIARLAAVTRCGTRLDDARRRPRLAIDPVPRSRRVFRRVRGRVFRVRPR